MSDVIAIHNLVQKRNELKNEIAKIIVGQDAVVDQILLCVFSGGHALLVGVPGLAKTLMVNTLAQALGLDFKRIQFTPDLMPSDILGSEILDENRQFRFIKGPIFSNIVLADEINRTPPKTQAALLEAMQERSVTIAGVNYKLDLPYFVLATQNPIEQEGTYRLPEAQLDRFLFKINIDYPNLAEEIHILQKENNLQSRDKMSAIATIISQSHIIEFQELVKQILIEQNLIEYIAKIVLNTRENAFLYLGASPRASIAILNAAKGFAALRGRDFVTPDDIKDAAIPVLQHRVVVTPEREMEGITSTEIIKQIVDSVEIPR